MGDFPLPIPPHIWRRILAFAASGATGQITLNFNGGAIETAEVKERLGAVRSATRCESGSNSPSERRLTPV